MRFSYKIIVAVLTFAIGVFVAWLWLGSELPQKQIETVSTEQVQSVNTVAKIEPEEFVIETQNVENFYYDAEIEKTLKRLVAYKSKSNRNTFYISAMSSEDNDSVWAFWKEDKSIIILHLSELKKDAEWLYFKYRIDFVKEVVPTGKYGNLGCCLVEKDWADEVLAKCKTGKKLTIYKNSL
jgi:hypothetical protein